MKKEFNLVFVILLLVGCQEPDFRKTPKVDEPIDQVIVEPEVKSNKSARSGRFISYPYWNMYRGNCDGLWYNYSSNGINWSSSSQVNSGALLEQAPETIFFNNRLIAAHRGRSGPDPKQNERVWITYSDDGINWVQIGTNITTTSTPALVVKDGLLFVYATNAGYLNDGTVFQWSTSDLINWNSNLVSGIPGNYYSFGLSAALDGINRIHLFYHIPEGGNTRMKSSSSNDGINFGGPTQVVRDYGVSTGVDNDAVSRGTTIAMVYRSSGNVRVIPDIINSPTTSYPIPNSSTSRGPSITYYSGRLVVTYKGNSTNNVWFSYSNNNGISWSAQTTHPGATPSGPSITAIGAN